MPAAAALPRHALGGARSGKRHSRRAGDGRARPCSSSVAHGQVVPIPAAVLKHRQQAARAIAGLDHPIGIGGGECHHLVDDAVAAGVERSDSQLGVCVMRRGDHDELHVGVSQGSVKIGIAAHAFPAFGYGLLPELWVASDDSVQPQAGLTPHQRAMKRPTRQPISDNNGCDHVLFNNKISRQRREEPPAEASSSMTAESKSSTPRRCKAYYCPNSLGMTVASKRLLS